MWYDFSKYTLNHFHGYKSCFFKPDIFLILLNFVVFHGMFSSG